MFEDTLPGGKGDNKPDSDFDSKELKIGIKDEREHTSSNKISKEIAKDHLTSDPRYYSKMKKKEKEEKTESCGTGAGYMSAVENSKIANEKEEKKRKKKAKLESFTRSLGKYLNELKYDGVSRLTGQPHYPDGARSVALKIKDTLTKKAFNNKLSNKQYVLKREKIKSVEDKVVHDMVTDFVTKY